MLITPFDIYTFLHFKCLYFLIIFYSHPKTVLYYKNCQMLNNYQYDFDNYVNYHKLIHHLLEHLFFSNVYLDK